MKMRCKIEIFIKYLRGFHRSESRFTIIKNLRETAVLCSLRVPTYLQFSWSKYIMTRSRKLRERNLHGWEFDERSDKNDSQNLTVIRLLMQTLMCLHDTFVARSTKFGHTRGISNKNGRISMRPYRWSVLKRWLLYRGKRFARIQIWLQNAWKCIRNVVSLANKYSCSSACTFI